MRRSHAIGWIGCGVMYPAVSSTGFRLCAGTTAVWSGLSASVGALPFGWNRALRLWVQAPSSRPPFWVPAPFRGRGRLFAGTTIGVCSVPFGLRFGGALPFDPSTGLRTGKLRANDLGFRVRGPFLRALRQAQGERLWVPCPQTFLRTLRQAQGERDGFRHPFRVRGRPFAGTRVVRAATGWVPTTQLLGAQALLGNCR